MSSEPVRIIGVEHTRDGIRSTLRFLHLGAQANKTEYEPGKSIAISEVKAVNPKTPSGCKGMRVGVELSKDELEYLQKENKEMRLPPESSPAWFWSMLIQYANGEGLTLVPIDNHRMKRFYEAAQKKIENLRRIG